MSIKCLICYSDKDNFQLSNKCGDNGVDSLDVKPKTLLLKHLDVIFVLRTIFQVPITQLSDYLKNCPEVDNWICICEKCNELVSGYRAIYNDLMDISRKVEQAKHGIIGIVKKSYQKHKISLRTGNNPVFVNITDECRQFINDYEYQRPINPFTDGDLKALELLNKQTLVKSEDQDKPIFLSEKRTTIRSKIKSDIKLTTTINSTIDTYPDDDDSFSNDNDDAGFEPDDINSDDNDEDEIPSCNPRKPNPSYNDADDWEPDDINSDDNHEEERPSSTPNKRKRSSKEEDEWKPDDESSSDDNEDESFLKSLISKKRKKNKSPTEWKPNNIRKDKDPFRIHRCPHCPAKYTTNAILIIHVKDKHPNVTPPPKAKPGAKRKYPDEFYTSCRTERVKPRVPSQCPYCSKNYKTVESMKNHIRSSHLLKFDFNCGKCGAGMSNEQLLNSHELLCSDERPAGPKKKCPEEGCLVSVPLMVGLETHFKDKHPDRSLFSKCPICEAGFYTKLGYDRHIQRDHKDIRLFRCDHCGVAFKMKRSLTRHKAKIHGEGELTEAICDHCGLSFVCQYNLNEHVKRMHEDKYKFRCDQCGRGFAEEEPLKVHSFKKHGIGRVEDLRWRCEVEGCGRIFLRRHRYSKHMNMHYDKGKGPQFTCEECGKQFWEKYSLTYHKKGIHESKEKNEKFTCEVCGAEFGFKDYLVRHKRVVHKIFPQRRT